LQTLSIDLGTELGPAISLAYEGPEHDLISRPPRNIAKDRIVAFPCIFHSYVLVGGIHIICGFAAFLWVYANFGIPPAALWNTASSNFQPCCGNYNDFHYGNNQTYGDAMQAHIQAKAAASFYLVLVLGQAVHMWMLKASRYAVSSNFLYEQLSDAAFKCQFRC
jgi:sodium/potassium-transporting ATPase subunit alpha